MEYSVNKIDNLQDFMLLKTAWDQVLGDEQHYRPFLDHDWFKLWLDHFGHDKELLILIARHNGSIEAILPLFVTNTKYKGLPIRKIELIGNVYSPIRNFIWQPKQLDKTQLLEALFTYLKNYPNWHLMELNSLPKENFQFGALREILRMTGLKAIEYSCFGNWYLENIDYSSEQYLENRPKIIRKDVPYCQRRLTKTGELEFRLIQTNDQIDHYMDLYYDVYSRSWQENEDIGPNFHRDLARMASKKGTLRLGFLFLDGVPVSSQFWIVSNATAYILKTVYDKKKNKFSPGKVLTMLMIKHVIDKDKIKEIDYLHGAEDYKSHWLPQYRKREGFLIFKNSGKASFLYTFHTTILPFMRSSRILKKLNQVLAKSVFFARQR